MNFHRFIPVLFIALLFLVLPGCSPQSPKLSNEIPTTIDSLSELTIDALRKRSYRTEITIETKLDIQCVDRDTVTSLPNKTGTYKSYMASYDSDGLRVYTRLNIPDGPVPAGGFPTIVFAHGWVGAEAAPTYTLGCDPESMYSENTDAYARAGYAVVIPGYRGHATVNDVPGEGIEFMHAYDNGSYLSPIFYAIDVMNLLAGIESGIESPLLDQNVQFDTSDLKLTAHSQGGDVALTVLAATGEGAQNGLEFTQASIWSGTFPDRFTQVRTYHAMQKTPEAFLSGDGSWNGTAIGKNGEVNQNFVFGYPRDWIETPNPDEWTWQKDTWDVPTVKDAVQFKLDQMYSTLNDKVEDLAMVEYKIQDNPSGSFGVVHDPAIAELMPKIGGFGYPQYLREPLILHFPDRDFSSFPVWNKVLCARIRKTDGQCATFEYAENTHGMRLGKHNWHTSAAAVEGYAPMVARDIEFFDGGDPASIPFP
jgi:dienelactone hydrolase